MDNSLKWVLFIKANGQITTDTLWKEGEVILLNENRCFFFFSCSEVLSLYTKNIRFMSAYFLFDGV